MYTNFHIRKKANFHQFIQYLDIPDFDMLLICAIGSCNLIQENIKVLYDLNKEYYFELFKGSPYYEDSRIKSLSILNYRAIQQFTGLYLAEKKDGKNDTTMMLIKRGFKFIYNFVKNKRELDFYELRDAYLKHVKKQRHGLTVGSAHMFGIALYLADVLNKNIIYDLQDLEIMNASFTHFFSYIGMEEEKTESSELIKRYQMKGLKKSDFPLPLNHLITEMNNIHKQEYADENGLDLERHLEHIQNYVKEHHPFVKGLNQISIILYYLNINPIDLQNITTITYERWQELAVLAEQTLQENHSEEELYSNFAICLIVFALGNDYNTTKHHYVITSSDETFQEFHRLKREFEERFKDLQSEEQKQEKEKQTLIDTNANLADSITKLEIQLQKKELEIIHLREQVNNLKSRQQELETQLQRSKTEPKAKEPTVDEMAEELGSLRCVIVGGSKSWVENMKDYFSNGRFIAPEELSIDLDFLAGLDVIIFNETVNNHSMYSKIKTKAASFNLPIIYTGAHTNIEISLREIYRQINNS